jgi:hypothetical protein
VEITPEREYLIVMEFFTGAQEIGTAQVDDRVIDSGLLLIRRLWDAELAPPPRHQAGQPDGPRRHGPARACFLDLKRGVL